MNCIGTNAQIAVDQGRVTTQEALDAMVENFFKPFCERATGITVEQVNEFSKELEKKYGDHLETVIENTRQKMQPRP